jgi:hypothetical protein
MGALVAVIVGAGAAAAQPVGYAVVGPSGYSGFFGSSISAGHVAGGGEFLVGGRAGGGGEFGLIAGTGGGLWVTSANGVFHILPGGPADSDVRVSPFVTGGYTRMSSGDGGFNGWNAGAGADVWLKPHVGLRLEFRDHVRPDSRGTVHYWSFRAGVAFR